jgi:peptide/nickel transport system ATP-binding protein/oligopeptide transport system ATP-binding protein
VSTLEKPILDVSGLRKEFRIRSRGVAKTLTAIDGMSFQLRAGETVAIVGESGSGKSTVARCITRLVAPTSGEVLLAGVSMTSMSKRALREARSDLQMVFQDPIGSLDPRMTVAATIDEPLRLHLDLGRKERAERVRLLLNDVGLSTTLLDRYPRQLSGGQRQRVGIARALAVEPKVLVLDEPTASLDVSVRRHVLELLQRIREERNLAYLFISHDLAVVRSFSDRLLVLYLGGVVEEGPTAEIFARPLHPYTRALLSAATVAEFGRLKQRVRLTGEIPSPIDLPSGCRLSSRCPLVQSACSTAVPPLVAASDSHLVACPVVLRGLEGKEVHSFAS